MSIKAFREKQAKLVADARARLDEIKDDTTEERIAEIEREYDAFMDEHDRLEARVKREERLASAEEQRDAPDPRRPRGEDIRVAGDGSQPEITREVAFDAFLRYGLADLSAEMRSVLREMRAQSVGNDAAGGFTVPQGFQAELVKALAAWGPMLDPGVTRQLETSSGNQLEWPTTDDTANVGAILAENTQDAEQDLVFGQKVLDAFKYTSKIIRVSEELLQDSAFNVEALVRDAMAERIARIVNTHLTTGTGTGQPNGIVTAAANSTIVVANTAGLDFDDMIDLAHSVDPAYRADPSCRFMFHDSTLKVLRKVKDLNGAYIWSPADQRTGQPAQILGFGYVVNQAMPVIGASSKSIVFGAFSQYVVRRVREFMVKRLVERYADFYQVGFLGFSRFDGELLNTAAVKYLTFTAA